VPTENFDSGTDRVDDDHLGTPSPVRDDTHPVEEQAGDQESESGLLDAEIAPSVPVFYDADRRRWPWFVRIAGVGLALLIVGLVIFVISLFALPLMPYYSLPKVVSVVRDTGNLDPLLTQHEDRQRRILALKLTRDKQGLGRLNSTERTISADRQARAREFLAKHGPRRDPAQLPSPLPGIAPAPVPVNASTVVAGFYVDWEQSSRVSAEHNIGNLTHFVPEWLHLKPAGTRFADPNPNTRPFIDARNTDDRTTLTQLVRAHSVPIVALINNFTSPRGSEAGEGNWDSLAVHQIVSVPAARHNVVVRLRNWLVRNQLQGINIDFEQVSVDDRAALVQFMKELYAALHPLGLLVTQDIEIEGEGYDMAALARWNDWVVPMFYDEHADGTPPGPVAGLDWTRDNLMQVLHSVPPAKIVMGVSNEGYNWIDTPGQMNPPSLGYQDAVMTARESYPDADIRLASGSLNPTFSYSEDVADPSGHLHHEDHVVWMLDAVTVYNQLQIARPLGVRGAALWVLGQEDPSVWGFFSKLHWSDNWTRMVSDGVLNRISFADAGLVDFDGEGVLLQPKAEPTTGERSVRVDPVTGLITSETYARDPSGRPMVPTGFVVRRYGGLNTAKERAILLSFDDGPDPTWTPQVLDILKRYQVPALFFDVGKQAEENPDLVRREWDEGHLIGNHSWDHPYFSDITPEHQKIELTATQRIIEAITGRSTTLFRPPFGGDTEPQTGTEVRPLSLAASLNYITVGELNDPQDWRLFELKPGTETSDTRRPRTAQSIVDSVVVNRDVGGVVLLHDAGGDRHLTVEALPQIITRLRKLGYRFVSLDQLVGIPRDRLMPQLTGRDTMLVGSDKYLFEVSYLFQRTITTLFLLSIWLGVSRSVLFTGLALAQRVREKRRVFPVGYTPSVSVIIAAYNEEKVISQTISALLASGYPALEVIVVDDGSKDRTFDIVKEAFGGEGRVRVFRKANGGKASALNRGLAYATGEVIVSLDADTLFAPDTIERLARHFASRDVGAVSGNVRVGNARNIFTKWQALEYTTSQNFDRRGYDLLNCITVVPGAVGALRRNAVSAVGGYTSDTLAEDTDLTWKLRRAGWRIVNDNTAMAYTEAPETLSSLAKQRFRWAYGTLQCLWKHRAALFSNGAFGWLALPSLWVYQILFPAVSPFMDIGIVYALFAGRFLMFGQFFLAMLSIELVAAFIALRMDRGNMGLLPYLVLQRFVYRQLMYYVVLKSLITAMRGSAVGWNKLDRTGAARIDAQPPAGSKSESTASR
jgi:cellulose synthase/poly-beta-1,6-N-acetylglucosamine synthase-like glycosyltransferase/peptidoglycan/xylan/chitin deacetylase (PgdA/CDA1 family)/spore germination protein YaaH